MGRLADLWRALARRVPPARSLERKHSAVGGLAPGAGGGAVAWFSGFAPHWTPRTYGDFAAEGYRKNVVAFRSVRMVSEAAASVPWKLFDGGRSVDAHPLLDLLDRPNPVQGGNALFEAFYGYLLIAGNAYLEAAADSRNLPRELYALRPDRMKVVPGPQGWPVAYLYSVAGKTHRFAVDAARGEMPILQLKSFNPLDDHYGMSPIEAAAFGIDIHNAAGAWNKALLDNAARPSGALVFEPGDGAGTLTPSQFDRLKTELARQYQGAANAGRPLLSKAALLAGDVAVAGRHGFHRIEACLGARDRARLRRAADALGHPGRQHLCELSGGEPRALAPDHPAASRQDDRRVERLARAEIRRRPHARPRYRRHPGARRRARRDVVAARRRELPHPQRKTPRGRASARSTAATSCADPPYQGDPP